MICKKHTLQRLSAKYLIAFSVIGILTSFAATRERTSPGLGKESFILRIENVIVKGRVTDQEGNAIANAVLKIKNTSKTSKTDVAGVFELNDVPLKSVILVSHARFSGEEFKISKPKPYYRIVLKSK